MKRESHSNDLQKTSQRLDSMTPQPLEDSDPVWDILGKASEHKADALFARNVVRSARLLENTTPTLLRRITGALSLKKIIIPTAVAACIGALVITQLPTDENGTASTPTHTEVVEDLPTGTDSSMALSDLIIDESLMAAADDPTIFTRDEVAAMIGL